MLPVTVRSVSLGVWRLKTSQRYHNRHIHRTCHPATFSNSPI
nr:unnamed protein product [Callosobruchus chinensis]